MKLEDIKSGVIIDYPYLWRWQQERGETEGRKTRPVCVAIAVRHAGRTYLALLAISGSPPRPGRHTLELTEIECRRAGLKAWKSAWITIDEYNFDIAEASYYLDLAQEPRGQFSKSFMKKLAREFAPFFRTRQARIDRKD